MVVGAISALFVVTYLANPPRDGESVPGFILELAMCAAAGFTGSWLVQAGTLTMTLQASLLLFPDLDSSFAYLSALLPIASASTLGRWRAGVVFSSMFMVSSAVSETQGGPPPILTQVILSTCGWLSIVGLVWATAFGVHQLNAWLNRKYATALDDQRRTIARQLHDTAAQSLGRISLISESTGAAENLNPTIRDALHEIGILARTASEDLDAMLEALRHSNTSLDTAFEEAISLEEAFLSGAANLKHEGFTPLVLNALGQMTIPPAYHDCLVAGIREVSRNIAKHGAPGTCTLHLSIDERRDNVTFTATNRIAEHRRAPATGGHGLIGVKERATILHGTFTSERSSHDQEIWLTSLTLPLRGRTHD
ncbi:hypothetical protein JS278_02133 [Acidipropionibacterium virtanenii]|uniref:Signal transduction histidine kinase subgroup 3 dimerisation and phosphoacceptor domain-containing protein n=2 Tax=Acidipropionibacterium virtanenii TaxID=2057246 RepID=A0A344UVI7_9ACTN|nr:hypothetical protein JS278_02133 [Acidipropionibacterium virtanenii]